MRSCSFTLPNRKGTYNDVEIPQALTVKFNGILKFEGIVDGVEKILKDGDFVKVGGVGLGYKLWDALLTKRYDAVNGKTIIQDAIALTDLTSVNVDPDNDIATTFTKEYFKEPAWSVIEGICRKSATSTGDVGFDFYIDETGDVYVFPWNKFPSSVTLKRGVNIQDFRFKRIGFPIKNRIWVFGKADKYEPVDGDAWTETLVGWIITRGTLELDSVVVKVGTYALKGIVESINSSTRESIFSRVISICAYQGTSLIFWTMVSDVGFNSKCVRLYAPDASNYFEAEIEDYPFVLVWHYQKIALGSNAEYHAILNPNGRWIKVGSPSWFNIQKIEFRFIYPYPNGLNVRVDFAHFFPIRFEGFAEDSGSGSSQEKYGLKPLRPIYNDILITDAQCLIVAEEELKRRKNPQRIIEGTVVPANLNLRQGDRIRLIDDIVHGIDEYARILEVTHALGIPFNSKLTLSTEVPSFAPEFAKVYEEIKRLEEI